MDYSTTNGASVDVICQHKRDGTIIPIKVRVTDDCGEYQIYMIRSYRVINMNQNYSMPDGIICSNHIMRFECKINIFNTERKIQLFYNPYDNKWRLFY